MMVSINHDKRISVDELRELLRVDDTGELFWCQRGSGRHIGKPAGTSLRSGYRKVGLRVDGKFVQFYTHQIVWALHYGEWPERSIDHINGNRGDNRVDNLRLASALENNMNRRRSVTNRAGRKWVSLHKNSVERGKPKPWQASVWRGKDRRRRYFSNPDEAFAWASSEARELHGDFYNPGHP